jgi:hypothetical protein
VASRADPRSPARAQSTSPLPITPVNSSQPQAAPKELRFVMLASRSIPQAGVEAGDAIVIRPDHKDPASRCLVQRPVELGLLLEAVEDGSLEIICAESASPLSDPRSVLRRLIQRPLKRLSLVR